MQACSLLDFVEQPEESVFPRSTPIGEVGLPETRSKARIGEPHRKNVFFSEIIWVRGALLC